MPELTIDGRSVTVPEGTTILDAARTVGIAIPTLCHHEGIAAGTSCFVCVVRVDDRETLVPSCATEARDGMRVDAGSDDVVAARRMALELLLSDHVGDCMGPCQAVCPAHMNIPRMIRQIAAGDMRAAAATVKARIPLPAVLGRICHAPCERACRRDEKDAAVSIMLLKRAVGDTDIAQPVPHLPQYAPSSGKHVAIAGSGPAGLSATYYLLQRGHACTIFDEREEAGGMLRYGVAPDDLPHDVLDAEIDAIRRLGAEFQLGQRVDAGRLAELRDTFDAVILACGELDEERRAAWPEVPLGKKGIQVNPHTLATSLPGVFAAGDAVRPARKAVNAVGAGRVVALSVSGFLETGTATGPANRFNSRIGKLLPGEVEGFMQEAEPDERVVPAGGGDSGLTADEAAAESRRCLHCDCRKADACALRDHSEALGAKQRRFHADHRKPFRQSRQHANVVYEPGKCIKCGLCVQVTETRGEALGLAFVGRGFDVRIGVPFDEQLGQALAATAEECVSACPTGALAALDTR